MSIALLSVSVSVAIFSLYWRFGYGSLSGGDSGELAAEACSLGVAHPPGYPLLVLLGGAAVRAWSALSAAAPGIFQPTPPILVLNRLCALLGAVCAGLQCAATCALGELALAALDGGGGGAPPVLAKRPTVVAAVEAAQPPLRFLRAWDAAAVRLCGAAVAIMTACAPAVWEYSTQFEVFALNNALCAALLLLALAAMHAAARGGARAPAIVAALLRCGALASGAALANQHTSVLLVAPCAALGLALHAATHGGWRSLLLLRGAPAYAGCLTLGLAPYAWLPLSHGFARVAGSWGDASSLAGFARQVDRKSVV